jgi:hypothetical protein
MCIVVEFNNPRINTKMGNYIIQFGPFDLFITSGIDFQTTIVGQGFKEVHSP